MIFHNSVYLVIQSLSSNLKQNFDIFLFFLRSLLYSLLQNKHMTLFLGFVYVILSKQNIYLILILILQLMSQQTNKKLNYINLKNRISPRTNITPIKS